MPYHIGNKGSNGCSGYPVVDDKGKAVGCHPTREKAINHMQALYANVPDANKSDLNCCPEENITKQDPCWEGYVQRGMKPGKNGKMVPNCVPAKKANDLWEDDDSVIYETGSINKADGYSPPSGARAAARRAIKFKEDGKANGAGTNVGWTRAHQLASGESLSLDTVKRMYSYFSRHEVDKKGKDWGNSSNPSNGYIMWLAWGGDAGYSWSRRIVNAEKDKKIFAGIFDNVIKADTPMDVAYNPIVTDPIPASPSSHINPDAGMKKPQYLKHDPKNPNCQCDKCMKLKGDNMSNGIFDRLSIEKRDPSTKERQRMAEAGTAMPDGSFPIANGTDLHNAIQSVGRAKNYDAAKKHIIRRARALGMLDQLPEDWKNSTKNTEWGGSIFDLNPIVNVKRSI